MNKKSCGWKIFFEVIFCSPKDSQLLAPWPSVKCISYIGKNPLQTKIKYVKNLEHVQFFVGRGQVDFGKEQPLCPVGRKLRLFYFSFYNEYASSSSSWQQPEQRIDSCFATVWLSSILLLQVFLIVHKKLVLEWFTINLELQVSRAQFSVPPLHWEQLNKYLNFQHDQEDFDFVCFLFTKRPNAGSSRLKEGSIALVLSEGAHIPRWQT